MKILASKTFDRFARKQRIKDNDLVEVVDNANKGLFEADLGSGVFKLRLARSGQGKSGGYRTLLAMKIGEIAFFVYGYSKNDRDNIGDDELAALKKLAGILLAYKATTLRRLIDSGEFREVIGDE